MQQSPLMDEVGFTRAVEQAYRQMWQLWCAQQQQSDNSTH
jgi:predicted O-linked N-acetylglucosamine transferase (SPINDLY family)